MPIRTPTSRRANNAIIAIIFAVVLALLFSSAAYADDEPANNDQSANETMTVDTTGNVVNVNQMPDSSFLYNTDISELSGAESFHDTQTVQVTGEVVGDRINDEVSSDLSWITLQSVDEDDYSTVSVVMNNEQASLIDHYGNYHTEGTELQVRGIFYLSCPEHQGLSDIHAQEVMVVHAGQEQTHSTNPAVVWAAALALGLGLLSWFTYTYLRERRK